MNILRTALIVVFLSIPFIADADGQDSCAVTVARRPMINVKAQGATGDGVTDDSKALQRAIDQASAVRGVVFVPDGIYLIDAVKGIRLKSDVILSLSDNAIIKAAPNGSATFSILRIENVSNVAVMGGVLLGERYEHLGKSGEWGMGLWLAAANNIVIKNLVSKNNWGDGFYLGGDSKDVKFCAVLADGNRRQGMSIVSGENILVSDSSFINTKGAPPQAGLDIEPNAKQMVKGVKIVNSRFCNNSGPGIVTYAAFGPSRASIFDIEINENVVCKNDNSGISIFNTSAFKIIGNKLKENKGNSIFLDPKTRAGLVTRNKIFHDDLSNGVHIINRGINTVSDNYSY